MLRYALWRRNKHQPRRAQAILLHTLLQLSLITACTSLLRAEIMAAEPIPQRINFQHFLENKDIAVGEARVFLQDSLGFMWIGGSAGLIRYDGYEFKFVLQTVQTEKGAEKRPLKSVNHIYEDSDKILWIATRTGILRYDPRTELLIKIDDDPSSQNMITTANTYRSLELPSGELLIASGSGLIVLDRRTLSYSAILPDKTKKDWLMATSVNVVYRDREGILWLGTGAGIEKLDWATKKFTLFKPFPEQPDFIEANTVNDIVADQEGTLWVGTINGLVHFNPHTLTHRRYVPDLADNNSISGKEIAKVLVDHTGALWVASDGGGLSIFERTEKYPEGRFINHKHEPGRPSSLNSNQVRTIYEDRAGDIWIGNYPGGINYFNRSSTAVTTYTHDQSDPTSLSHSAILAVNEDHKGNFWLGTDGGGLNYFDRDSGKFTHYQHDVKDENSFSGNAVLDVFVADDGKVWGGTWGGGISILDPATGIIERMPFDTTRPKTTAVTRSNRLNNSTVWSIKQDNEKNIWIGTHSAGLSKFNPSTGLYIHYTNIQDDPTSITGGVVWSTFEDSQGNFWVGTATGLDLMDRETETFTHFIANPDDVNGLRNPQVLAFFEDSKNRFWIGTEGGLHLMNRSERTFTVFNKTSGFIDDTIRTILEAPDGLLWVSTNNGISVFDPETKKIRNFNRDSGQLIGTFHTNSGLISRNGEIIFGGVEGLRIFDAEKLKENKVIPPLAFTELKIFADVVNVGDADGLLPSSLNYTDTIVLDYQKTMFQLGFSALNFRDSAKNKYAYKLEGFDENWLEVDDQRSAKYTNLNAGTYVFRVKGSNNDGIWNEEGAQITIVQLPPPWKTWWAYSLYGLTILTIIYLFVRSQRKKRRLVEEQNRLLELKVAERTSELREKNNDIKAMLSNMRQGLFTVESNGSIHPEYSRFLEDIFESNHLAGKNATELLFEKANLGSNAVNQVKEAMNAIIGEDEMNYGFNSHLLVNEYDVEFNGHRKYLSLDWNPIVMDKAVAKLMVSVRDVTLLKQMEADARLKKQELDIISQLLNVPAKKYLAFVSSTKRFIAENRATIENHAQCNETLLALLFRNMHTIKGNCRTFNFSYFSDVVHDVESVYSALKMNSDVAWDKTELLSDLLRVEDMLQEYERVYYSVLGRGEKGVRDANGTWADIQDIEHIQNLVDAVDHHPEINAGPLLVPVKAFVNRALFSPLSEVLATVVESLPSIAAQLGKEAPNVVFEENQLRIKSSAHELMNNIFAHILRNSIDHGIEVPEKRARVGKPEKGTIRIRAETDQHRLLIRVGDDGQGINIDRLHKKGIETGLWTPQDQPSYGEIANLIFASGISTKDQITTISGRGVGMDAVREFLLAQGGNIHLRLLGAQAQDNRLGQGIMVPFELVVELPESTFAVAA